MMAVSDVYFNVWCICMLIAKIGFSYRKNIRLCCDDITIVDVDNLGWLVVAARVTLMI